MTAPPCLACSCVESSEAERFEKATAVFTGTVTDVEDAPTDPDGGDRLSWRIEVESVEKGGAAPMEHVITGTDGDTCAPGFEIGERFQVYASRNSDGRLETNICAGTHALDEEAEPEVVAPTRPPEKTAEPSTTGEAPQRSRPKASGAPAEQGNGAAQPANPQAVAAAQLGSDGPNSIRDWTVTVLVWSLIALPIVLMTGRRKKTTDA